MGLSNIKNMSRQEPCPICGKPDYCFWSELHNNPGMYILLCRRSSEAVETIIAGNDGNSYIAIPKNNKDVIGTYYENVKQREDRKKRFISGEQKEFVRKQYTVIDSITPLSNTELDSIYRNMMQKLPLYKFHAQYLLKEGWNMEMIKKNLICSFPAKNISKLPPSLKNIPTREQLAKNIMADLNLSSLTGVPGAYKNSSGHWTFHGPSGIIFPVYDSDRNIYRIRIRLDYIDLPVHMQEDKRGFYYLDNGERITVSMSGPFAEVGEKRTYKRFSTHEGKYRNFSSYKENPDAYKAGFIENIFHKGCEAKNQIMFALQPNDDQSVFWITEGEKKAIFANQVLQQPVIGLPGVNDYAKLKNSSLGKSSLSIMKQKGYKTVIVAFDADRYRNEMVMRCMNGLISMLKEEGFHVFIADWNEANGKGLDDLLAAGYLPAIRECK